MQLLLPRQLPRQHPSAVFSSRSIQHQRHSATGAMHTAVPRVARGPDLKLDPALESVPLALPGLISSLRPIRRNAAQLADEAALLRRFMYKHKNQHKGQRWWKRIVEVDRCASRALEELSRWLAGFGMR